MQNKPLFSMVIVTYKNFRYLFETLDSVFMQDYENIELIISNDCSDDFDESELITYLNNNRTSNIVKVIINKNETNMGTVKHLNKTQQMASGKYIWFLAGDDAIYDDNVISKFVEYLENAGSNAYVATSQCGMYDIELKRMEQGFVSNENKQKLNSMSPLELFKESAYAIKVASGATVYNRKIFEDYGLFDENYFLIEDHSYFLKLFRLGVRVHYLDFISIKHRDGGISHGNENNDSAAYKFYYEDEIKIFEKEILPYKELLGDKAWRELKERHRALKFSFYKRYKFKNDPLPKKLAFLIANDDVIFSKLGVKLRRKIVDFSMLKANCRNLFLAGVLLLFLYSFINLNELVGESIGKTANMIFGYFGLVCIGGSIFCLVISAVYKIYMVLKRGIQSLR